jgi:hypothetical protein
MLNGISPKAAIFGIPKKSNKLKIVRVSARITNKFFSEIQHHLLALRLRIPKEQSFLALLL